MDPEMVMEMASSGTSILGQLFQGVTGLIAGHQQARAYRLAAERASNEAGVNAQEALISGDQQAADAAVHAAASGGGGISGSSLNVIQAASERAMFNARAQAYRGATEAANDLYESKIARDNGINGLISSFIGSAGKGADAAATAGFRSDILNSKAFQQGDISSYDLMGLQ